MTLLQTSAKQHNINNITLANDNLLVKCNLSKASSGFYDLDYETKKMIIKNDLLIQNLISVEKLILFVLPSIFVVAFSCDDY